VDTGGQDQRDPGSSYFLCDFLGPEWEDPLAFTDWERCTLGGITLGCGGGEVTGCSRAWVVAAFASARGIWGEMGVPLSIGRSLLCPLAWECRVAAELEEEGK
jgi:hypothetical protein